MRASAAILFLRFLCWLVVAAGTGYGQRQGTTRLAVQVAPEAYLTPRAAAVRFQVEADGSVRVLSAPVDLQAWVRSLPGQRIEVVARPSVEVEGVRFNGVRTSATGGAQAAACVSGPVRAEGSSLVSGWLRSGILRCSVSFSIDPGRWSPGVYEVPLSLSLEIR